MSDTQFIAGLTRTISDGGIVEWADTQAKWLSIDTHACRFQREGDFKSQVTDSTIPFSCGYSAILSPATAELFCPTPVTTIDRCGILETMPRPRILEALFPLTQQYTFEKIHSHGRLSGWAVSGLSAQAMDPGSAGIAFYPHRFDSTQSKYEKLIARWKRETTFISSTSQMNDHPAMKAIIAIGKDAVPLLLKSLDAETLHVFGALRSITSENPVPVESRGKVEEMRVAWLQWGRMRGLI